MPNKAERELKTRQLIQQYCLMDDNYMTVFFKDNIEATELILKILLNKDDLKVKKLTVQDIIKNLQGHSATMDIVAVDSDNKIYNIEVQNASSEAHPKRARYYSSLLDANALPKGDNYETLPDTYVIFITKTDVFDNNKMLYHFIRRDETRSLDDGSHILYVNSENRDNSAIGRLMQDFICTNPNEMCYDELRKKSLQIKGNEEGEEPMDKITEQIVELKMEDVAEDMLADGKLSFEDIARYFNWPVEKVAALAAQMK